MKVKFAYQAKLGISYPLSPSINLFADTYYHKSVGNQFKNLRVQYAHTLQDTPFFFYLSNSQTQHRIFWGRIRI